MADRPNGRPNFSKSLTHGSLSSLSLPTDAPVKKKGGFFFKKISKSTEVPKHHSEESLNTKFPQNNTNNNNKNNNNNEEKKTSKNKFNTMREKKILFHDEEKKIEPEKEIEKKFVFPAHPKFREATKPKTRLSMDNETLNQEIQETLKNRQLGKTTPLMRICSRGQLTKSDSGIIIEEPFVNQERIVDFEHDMWNVPDDERCIIMNPDASDIYQIKAATLGKLIEKLTTMKSAQDHISHSQYIKIFLTTYRSYSSPEDVFDRITKRFYGPSDNSCIPSELNKIRRVSCFVLVEWFTDHFIDFCNNQALLRKLEDFITEAEVIDASNQDSAVSYLKQMVKRKVDKGTYTSIYESSLMIDKSSCPIPNVPKDFSSVSFMDLDDLEIARQITIAEHHIYAEIQPVELQDLAWSKPSLRGRAPNVLEMIDHFNKLSSKFSSIILSQPRVKDRRKVIEKLVRIAEHLLSINNYNMVMSIMSCFSVSSIFRMKYSFEGLSKKTIDTLTELNQMFSSNASYKVYREVFATVASPAIPCLSVYLSDLTFVDEGNANKINELWNFRKKQLEYDVIVKVLQFQSHPYNFKMVPKLTQFLNKLPILSEKEMYRLSLEYEPRNAKKKDVK